MNGASSSSANPSGVQGICPTGWHVPSDAEWTQLTDYVSSQSQYWCGSNSTYIAKSLASTTGWNSNSSTCAPGNTPSNNNSTGLDMRPAGYSGPSLKQSGTEVYYWTSTETSSANATAKYLTVSSAVVNNSPSGKQWGNSIRCVKD